MVNSVVVVGQWISSLLPGDEVSHLESLGEQTEDTIEHSENSCLLQRLRGNRGVTDHVSVT